jgi:hypothetical protein
MQDRIEEAVRMKEAATAALYRDDGTQRFADTEHRERLRTIEREFRAQMDAIEERIEERIERARGELAALENGDPASSLLTDELQRAAAMSVFVSDEVEGLSLADLARRVRAAVTSGDRAASYALLRHAARRQDEDITGEVREAVAELRGALDPGREEKAEAAKASLEEAEDLQFNAQLARAEAASIADSYAGGYWTGAAS